ncbi:MAG: hypothetical protein KAH11_00990 [Rhodospirillales bacterium]|jgi:hypothetical protein|nr:hypothetical protein [Rhodospirillales bacterium]
MFSRILELIGLGGPEHDARILARDARAMIDMIHGQHGADSLGKIANHAKLQIDDVHRRGLNDPQFYQRGVEALTDLNRAARSRRDNIAWSGITLAIIYIKSEMLGDLALPAKNAIDGFIEKWAHAIEEDGGSGEPTAEP